MDSQATYSKPADTILTMTPPPMHGSKAVAPRTVRNKPTASHTTTASPNPRFLGKSIHFIGIGGIACVDDVMEFIVAGASAVQLGTVNFYDPTACVRIAKELPAAFAELGAESVGAVVGTLKT